MVSDVDGSGGPLPATDPAAADDQPIRVLHVDDDPEFCDVVVQFLGRANDRFEVETATDAESALAAMGDGRYDCIVSDYDMPGPDGIGFLERVREREPDLPFILFTGKGSESIASEAISAGVTDYLQKQVGVAQYEVLANRIENAVDRYRTVRELNRSRDRHSLLFQESPMGIVEWDEQFRFARVNPAAEEILGYPASELVGQPWERIVPASDRQAFGAVIAELKAASGGYHCIAEVVRNDGNHRLCECHNRVVTDDDGAVVTTFTLFQDVTDREYLEAGIESRETRFRAIAENSSDAIITIDTDSTIRYANPAVERVFGYDPAELTGEPLTRLMPEPLRDRHRTALDRYTQTGERTLTWESIQMTGLHKDGHEIDLEISFSELETDDGHRFTGIVRPADDRD